MKNLFAKAKEFILDHQVPIGAGVVLVLIVIVIAVLR